MTPSHYRTLCRDVCEALGVDAGLTARVVLLPDAAMVTTFFVGPDGKPQVNRSRMALKRVVRLVEPAGEDDEHDDMVRRLLWPSDRCTWPRFTLRKHR